MLADSTLLVVLSSLVTLPSPEVPMLVTSMLLAHWLLLVL
jgi:hypothetical protein